MTNPQTDWQTLKNFDYPISKDLMPVAGLEPARGCPRQILSLMRLPFRHTGVSQTCCP